MNDKDKEAFMDWLVTKLTKKDQEYVKKGEISPYFNPSYENGKPDINEAWQAACEYKDKQIDILINHDIAGYKEGIDCLTAQNKKLREALSYYANTEIYRRPDRDRYGMGGMSAMTDFEIDDGEWKCDENGEKDHYCYGKRAREALKEAGRE